MGVADEEKQLGELETFNPAAFDPDDRWGRELCDFVLALSVTANDLRDIYMLMFLLESEDKAYQDRLRPGFRGFVGGLSINLRRLAAGILHELLNLVRSSRATINSSQFHSLYKRLDKDSKKAWDRITDAANEKPAKGNLGKALTLCRNKVGFHYDARQIGVGYRKRFSGRDQDLWPVLARGNSMRARRFFFADASVEQYLSDQIEDPEVEKIFAGGGQLMLDIRRALYDIVIAFINARNFAYRKYRA